VLAKRPGDLIRIREYGQDEQIAETYSTGGAPSWQKTSANVFASVQSEETHLAAGGTDVLAEHAGLLAVCDVAITSVLQGNKRIAATGRSSCRCATPMIFRLSVLRW
jgi:hypothetical protein